jgi:predicted metalloprotease with PDZ domain
MATLYVEEVPDELYEALRRRPLPSTSPGAPGEAIEAAGWKVIYHDRAPARTEFRGTPSASTISPGLILASDGAESDAIYNGPAFQTGISSGMKVVGVSGRVYAPALLSDAIKASKSNSQPIQLWVVSDDYYRTCTNDYHGGERYPHVVRDTGKPDYLDEMLKPLAAPN